MKNIKGYLSIIIIVLSIGYVCYTTGIRPVMIGNDSGFDTSYDGGGGGSYSSSDYSSHDSYDSNGETGGDISPVGVAVIIGIMSLIILFSITQTISKNKHSKKTHTTGYKELSEEEIRKVIPDFNLQQFLDDRLQDFIDIQYAWQNFDDKVLMEKLSGTLYNQYKMQLDTLKVKHQQNIMSDFTKNDMIVLSAKEENGKYIVEVGLVIAFKDYIVENGVVVRGDKDATIVQKYKLKFIKSKEEQYEFCPNCGAKLNDNNRQVCGYCHSTIYRVSTKWVMSEKTSLEQETLYLV
jgi:ribosomal protein S27AE